MQLPTDPLKTKPRERWQWQYQSNPYPRDKKEACQWKSYSLQENYLIEKAYYEKKNEVDLGNCIVSLKRMIQKQTSPVVSKRSIRRIKDNNIHKIDRSERFFETELPKTINKIFGSLGDFISFFSRRNQEILDFTNQFKELERLNDLDILNHKVLPKLVECFKEVLLKPYEEQLKDSTLLQSKKDFLLEIKKPIEELILRFEKKVLSFEEFYGRILWAYTTNTGLYANLNNYLRNESWLEVDKLLPYAFCLCKAFSKSRLQIMSAHENQMQQLQTLSSVLLYRGTAFDKLTLSFYDIKANRHFSWNSVTSTSASKKIAEEFMYKNADIEEKRYPVMFIIEITLETEFEEEYSRWMDIHQYSAVQNENEFILPPGSVFELVEVLTDQDEKTTINCFAVKNLPSQTKFWIKKCTF